MCGLIMQMDGVNGTFYNMIVSESSRSSKENSVQHDKVHDMVNDTFGRYCDSNLNKF